MDADDAITVEYKGEEDLEILVKPDDAFAYRRGEIDEDQFDRVLFVQEIFKDAQAAERAAVEEIEDVFGTRNVVAAAQQLFENGRMALTTEQRNQLREEKRKQIVSMIARRAMNPQTNSPHPPKRIENAMEEAGIQVEPMESAESQLSDVLDRIKPKIPISLEEKEIAIRIPNDYSGKCYGKIKQMATTVIDEEWGDEAFIAHVKLPAGVQVELMDELESITHGEVEVTDV
jgi:ribosome maturation protein SDO1